MESYTILFPRVGSALLPVVAFYDGQRAFESIIQIIISIKFETTTTEYRFSSVVLELVNLLTTARHLIPTSSKLFRIIILTN